jgi:fluoroacetyl-CoA thioesterase
MMLRVGLKGEKEMRVERRHLTDTDAFSTHSLVLLMELASRAAIENCLPEGKMTVGTMIHVRHFGISPTGSKVRAVSFLREIAGRRLVFDVAAFDGSVMIAEGQNEQLISACGIKIGSSFHRGFPAKLLWHHHIGWSLP